MCIGQKLAIIWKLGMYIKKNYFNLIFALGVNIPASKVLEFKCKLFEFHE